MWYPESDEEACGGKDGGQFCQIPLLAEIREGLRVRDNTK